MSVKLKTVLFFMLLLVLALVSFFGAALYFGEEVAKSAMAHAGGALILLGTFYLWRNYLNHNKLAGDINIKAWSKAGMFVLGMPFIYYTLMGGKGLYHMSQLAIFEQGMKIENYQEDLVKWPGFENPVGLRLKFDLVYPYAIDGKLHHPKILIGDQALTAAELPGKSYWDFCSDPVTKNTGCISYPVWPIRKLPELASGGRMTLTYELYPSNLYHLEDQSRVCLRKRFPYGKSEFLTGEITMLWPLANPHRHIQLGVMLEAMLKDKSEILRSAETVKSLFDSVQSQGFFGAGYQSCDVKRAIRFPEESECFCAPSGE